MSKWSSAYRDSRWQRKRLEVMERDGWACRVCEKGESDGVMLNVHHSHYRAGAAPWEYDADTLFTLCEVCHLRVHDLQRILSVSVMRASGDQSMVALLKRLIGYCDSQQGPALYGGDDYAVGFAAGRTVPACLADCKALMRAHMAFGKEVEL